MAYKDNKYFSLKFQKIEISQKMSFEHKMVKMTLKNAKMSENLTENYVDRDHLSMFGAENTHNSRPFEAENNA